MLRNTTAAPVTYKYPKSPRLLLSVLYNHEVAFVITPVLVPDIHQSNARQGTDRPTEKRGRVLQSVTLRWIQQGKLFLNESTTTVCFTLNSVHEPGQNRIVERIGPLSQSWSDVFDRLLLPVRWMVCTWPPSRVDWVCVCVSDGGSSRVTLQAGSLA